MAQVAMEADLVQDQDMTFKNSIKLVQTTVMRLCGVLDAMYHRYRVLVFVVEVLLLISKAWHVIASFFWK